MIKVLHTTILTPTFKMEIKMRQIWARLPTNFTAEATFKQMDSKPPECIPHFY